jgi:hypothetical protein
MITREQYLEALDLIESYHQQLRQLNIERNLTPIAEWDKFDRCSRRLKNVLYNIRQGTPSWVDYKEEFIENIQIHKMRKMPNCGKKSLNEFIELRGY